MKNKSIIHIYILLFIVFITAFCSLIYELIISTLSSYLIGDTITQFSITIGFFMFAMGLGSMLSKKINRDLLNYFIFIEIAIGLIGGFSTIILFLLDIYTPYYYYSTLLIIVIIGILIGLEIPILTRIIEKYEKLRVTIANVLSFDYIGGLIASLLFPLFLLPKLGLIKSSLVVGLINIFTIFLIFFYYKRFLFDKESDKELFAIIIERDYYKYIIFISVFVFIILFITFLNSDKITDSLNSKLYSYKTIFKKNTKYQHVVITNWKNDYRLYINGNLQFSTVDEYRYHESFVHIAMYLKNKPEDILILGGGDGLAVREILKHKDVKKITLVDIDKDIVDIYKTNPIFIKFNKNSLNDKKVKIINTDAFNFVKSSKNRYDIVFIDLPDPNNTSVNKMYTVVFYKYLKHILKKNGIIVSQSSSPYFVREAYWCISNTMKQVFKNVINYNVLVPAFGRWGFNLASDFDYSKKMKKININIETKFLDNNIVKNMTVFSKDIAYLDTKINTLINPNLLYYYKKWESF